MEFWEFITSILQILVIDVVLSGDNAVVIALAAHRLPQQQRRLAILCGAGGAIALRVLFTWVLAQLLGIPLLRFGGGVVLVWIAMKLLLDESDGAGQKVREGGNLLQAIWIIIMADFVMSLDNMLAVGGASEGHVSLILFGLVLSIAIIMTCSAVIAQWMNRFPILVVLGAVVLAWTAAEMMLEDSKVAEYLVSRHQLCIEKAWHEEFGGADADSATSLLHKHRDAKAWWTAWQDEIEHRHWIGWSVVAFIVSIVLVVPGIRSAVARRSAAVESSVTGAISRASTPDLPRPAEPPPAEPAS